MQSVSMLSQRESYVASKWVKFLWWLSTAEKELLVDCVIDRNRYAIIGMSVLGTWLFATLAWMYFFSTVVSNVFAIVFLGLFMGALILSIDRALIKGINKLNKQRLLPILFRGLLAVTIGTFMAQPALLYLFDKEIHLQVSLDNEAKKKAKRAQQDSLFATTKSELFNNKVVLQKQLADRYKEVSDAREGFITETDGTGGSKKIGLEAIAKAKKLNYEKLDADYQKLAAQITPQIKSIDSSLSNIENNIKQEQKNFEQLLNDGFFTRIEALNNLIKNNTALLLRYWLLVIILVLIELMPVIAKTLLPSGTYEAKLMAREAMEKTIVEDNMAKEQALKQQYNQLAFEQDSDFMKSFFEEAKQSRQAKAAAIINQWQQNENQSFDDLWQAAKDNLFSKQEH
jgi:hypothetical protein